MHSLPFSHSDVCFASSVFCHLWGRSAEARRLLPTQRHRSGQGGSVRRSPASRPRPALPVWRMPPRPLHLGRRWMGRSEYWLILLLYKFTTNRCLTISLRFLLAEISALSLSLCTVKRTACMYPFSLSHINREGFGDNHQSANPIKPLSTRGRHPFCAAGYRCSVSREQIAVFFAHRSLMSRALSSTEA